MAEDVQNGAAQDALPAAPCSPAGVALIASEADRNYMAWLFVQHHRLMISTARKCTNDPDAVEDVVSDSLLSLIRRIAHLRALDPAALRAYVVASVRSSAIDQYRRRMSHEGRNCVVCIDMIASLPDPDALEERVVRRDELRAVLGNISSLPECEQIVIDLKCLRGLRNDEITSMTGMSAQTIRKHLRRARARLGRLLRD